MAIYAMKDLSAGVAVFLRLTDRPDEFLTPIVLNIYKRKMGNTATQLHPVRFTNGVLFLKASKDSWLREGKRRSEIIRSVINTAAGCEVVTKVYFERGDYQPETSDVKNVCGHPVAPALTKNLVEASKLIRDEKLRKAFINFGSKVMFSAANRKRKD